MGFLGGSERLHEHAGRVDRADVKPVRHRPHIPNQGVSEVTGRGRPRRVIGQVSRRDTLEAFESSRDNPRLYGTKDEPPPDGSGVDSAMKIARGRR